MSNSLVFLKLGGSLITVKDRPHTPRMDVLERLAHEIAEACEQDPELRILVGHGSGSFGHVPASKYQTRQGVHTTAEWRGFVEVWHAATALNQLVMSALTGANLPVIAFPPSASVTVSDGKVETWNLAPIENALANGLLPLIHGDVVFDERRGGTILSTEDLFTHLALQLHPSRLLLAGIEPGVWRDYPHNTSLVTEITPASFHQLEAGISGSASIDVTGGMLDKVRQIVALVGQESGLEASIFSGEIPGNVQRALSGDKLGTLIHA